jgi:hypothetical protein
MKKTGILLAVITIAMACNNNDKQAEEQKPPEDAKPLSINKNNSVFNESFTQLLTAYLAVKDALVDYDTVKANAAAAQLAVFSDSLKTNEISGDTSGTIKKLAKDYAGTIIGSAKGFIGEKDLEKKKQEFNMISDALYNLIRAVRYDGQKLYHQHCPMAFGDNAEAFWISTSNEVVNPYLGKLHPQYKNTMLHCGDITDSIDYRK